MPKMSTKKVIHIALLIAVEIVLSRFCSISTPIVKIGFGFVPIAIAGMLYGPLWAGCAAAMADFMGAVLFPIGPYFPGFTLTAFLTGLTYGALLYGRDNWLRIILAVGIISIPLNLCLDSLWLYMISGQGYLALLPTRILKCVIMTPMQILVLRFATSRLYLYVNRRRQAANT